MLQPNLLLLLITLGCAHAVLEKDGMEHIRANMHKMGELRARWNRLHPLANQEPPGKNKDQVDSPHELTIPGINEQYVSELIGGDLIPSDEDIIEMEEKLAAAESGNSADRTKRAASVISAKNWPTDRPIPFVIGDEYDEDHKDVIRAALRTIAKNTCIDFEESSGSEPKMKFYSGEGCVTELGDKRARYGFHPVSLGISGGCVTIDTAQHEVMHALGFDHTHSRADRDHYIDIIRKDILPEYSNQFDKVAPELFDNHSIPYEYNSAMHYDSLSASIDGKTPIIIPKDEDYIASVGGDHGATFNDWKQINIRYRCSTFCNKQINCMNKGFQNSRNCSHCVCPIFYTGQYCEKEVNALNLIPGVNDKEQVDYTSTNTSALQRFRDFSLFEKQLRVVKAPEGRVIRITLDKIYSGDRINCVRECTYKAVEIVDNDLSLVGKRFCCANRTSHSFVSKANIVGYQAYSQPGQNFSSRVTFSLEPLTEGITTEQPQTESPEDTTELPAEATSVESATVEPSTTDPSCTEECEITEAT